MMDYNLAHAGRRPSTTDWAAWSASLTSASLVAPLDVARSIDDFGGAIQSFLDAVGTHDPVTDPVGMTVFGQSAAPAAAAHLDLLNVIRRSLGGSLGDISFHLGGSLFSQPDKARDQPTTGGLTAAARVAEVHADNAER
jgi:hypothetical protein